MVLPGALGGATRTHLGVAGVQTVRWLCRSRASRAGRQRHCPCACFQALPQQQLTESMPCARPRAGGLTHIRREAALVSIKVLQNVITGQKCKWLKNIDVLEVLEDGKLRFAVSVGSQREMHREKGGPRITLGRGSEGRRGQKDLDSDVPGFCAENTYTGYLYNFYVRIIKYSEEETRP